MVSIQVNSVLYIPPSSHLKKSQSAVCLTESSPGFNISENPVIASPSQITDRKWKILDVGRRSSTPEETSISQPGLGIDYDSSFSLGPSALSENEDKSEGDTQRIMDYRQLPNINVMNQITIVQKTPSRTTQHTNQSLTMSPSTSFQESEGVFQQGNIKNNRLHGQGIRITWGDRAEIGPFSLGKLQGKGIVIVYHNSKEFSIIIGHFFAGQIKKPRSLSIDFATDIKYTPIPQPRTYNNYEDLKKDSLFSPALELLFSNYLKIIQNKTPLPGQTPEKRVLKRFPPLEPSPPIGEFEIDENNLDDLPTLEPSLLELMCCCFFCHSTKKK